MLGPRPLMAKRLSRRARELEQPLGLRRDAKRTRWVGAPRCQAAVRRAPARRRARRPARRAPWRPSPRAATAVRGSGARDGCSDVRAGAPHAPPPTGHRRRVQSYRTPLRPGAGRRAPQTVAARPACWSAACRRSRSSSTPFALASSTSWSSSSSPRARRRCASRPAAVSRSSGDPGGRSPINSSNDGTEPTAVNLTLTHAPVSSPGLGID